MSLKPLRGYLGQFALIAVAACSGQYSVSQRAGDAAATQLARAGVCSGQASPKAPGEAPVQTAKAATHPLTGQVVGEREGRGGHDAYTPKALESLGGKVELVGATKGATFNE